MDPDTAMEFVKHGATLLILDVPQYTLIGIDIHMFSAGPAFKGIKMIPPGVHFVYYSSSSREGKEFSPVTGFFIDASPAQVLVHKWDQIGERLVKLSEEDEIRYREAVKRYEFDKQLGPYPLDQYGDWKRLSNYITKESIERLEPIGGEITVANESGIFSNVPDTSMDKALTEQLKESKFSSSPDMPKKKVCYYTSIPHVVKHKDLSGQDLTKLNLDKTKLLESLLAKDYGGCEDLILAELQFAFVAFLMGQSLEAFFQWKALVSLFLGCVDAPLCGRSQLFIKFTKIIYFQLKYGFQKDQTHTGVTLNGSLALLDESCLSSDIFLLHLCKGFFSSVLEAPVVDGDLLTWTRKLRKLLEDSLGWDFHQDSLPDVMSHEDDEFAPVVEILDDETLNEVPYTGLPSV